MRCPFGREVGDPPSVFRCPSGFPGCACGDEAVLHVTNQGNEQTEQVIAWWGEHSGDL